MQFETYEKALSPQLSLFVHLFRMHTVGLFTQQIEHIKEDCTGLLDVPHAIVLIFVRNESPLIICFAPTLICIVYNGGYKATINM